MACAIVYWGKDFDKFCEEIGLSVSAAFNIFAKTVVREQRIPFELTTETPNSINVTGVTAQIDNSFDGVEVTATTTVSDPEAVAEFFSLAGSVISMLNN